MDKQEYALNKEPVASIYLEVPKFIKLPMPRNASLTWRPSRLDSHVLPSLQQLWGLSNVYLYRLFFSPPSFIQGLMSLNQKASVCHKTLG